MYTPTDRHRILLDSWVAATLTHVSRADVQAETYADGHKVCALTAIGYLATRDIDRNGDTAGMDTDADADAGTYALCSILNKVFGGKQTKVDNSFFWDRVCILRGGSARLQHCRN